jgi:hypothetical protein
MKLFVDDRREAPEGWKLATTITQAINLLANCSVEEVSLDFDCGSCEDSFMSVAYYIALMNPRPKVAIHTDNPAGINMLSHVLFPEVRKVD